MSKIKLFLFSILITHAALCQNNDGWIRINQLGYSPKGSKVAVYCSKGKQTVNTFELIDATSAKVVYNSKASRDFGAYGPFASTTRLDFTSFQIPGRYVLRIGSVSSPEFSISPEAYRGSADFVLRYMRQQRSSYNPYLKDSCHTHDGYTLYGPMPDGTHIDVSGGWHDASDYLQYATTSANATYHLLAAYRDFPNVFSDKHLANGINGSNGEADVLDEANWGLQWLMKMHPRQDWMFNQIADDRDHAGYRLPNNDMVDYGYGKGKGRPVYFISGDVQGLGKYKNRATGTSSTAGKFASAFALGGMIYKYKNSPLATTLKNKSITAYKFGLRKPGVSQTAPNKARYFYEEDNWTDDMELAAAALYQSTGDTAYLNQGIKYSKLEPVTPWLGADTATHYQWYPFHNFGHYELADAVGKTNRNELIDCYRSGIEKVWNKSKDNAFYRGVPFIWCSNNLTTSFAIQCYLYRKLSGDDSFIKLEQACFDWLFGCNPWGTSMVSALPSNGDTPVDPHSSLNVLNKFPLDGGLVDGPVYGNIYKSLLGISLSAPDEYGDFQSDLAVYHDDNGDYSTNEPTMDGTASLVYLLAAKENESLSGKTFKQIIDHEGAIVRGDLSQKKIALVFTGDEYADGGNVIRSSLRMNRVKASFFLTGNFYRNPKFKSVVNNLKKDGHYLGAHSDKHLLYADWKKRDSLLVTRELFTTDLDANYNAMKAFGIKKTDAPLFLPPYEWYNQSIATWTKDIGLQLINFTPGTLSHADYTTPNTTSRYFSSDEIYKSIMTYEGSTTEGLNGFILLLHIGTDPARTDKFYNRLDELIKELKGRNYQFVRVDELLTR